MTLRQKAAATAKALFTLLKALPFIRLGLALGGAIVWSAGAAWIIWVQGYGDWPDEGAVAVARVVALMWLGLGALGLVAIVLFGLVWGQLDKFRVSIGGNSVDLDFESPKDQRDD